MKIKGVLKLIFSRLFAVAITVIAQVALFGLWLFRLNENVFIVQIILVVLSVLVVVIISNQKTHPEQKILWYLVVLAFPVIGIPLYILFTTSTLFKGKIKKYGDVNQEACLKDEKVKQEIYDKAGRFANDIKYIENVAKLNASKNTNCTYLKDGESFYHSLIKDLKNAKKFIFLEYFIINTGVMWDSILAILKEKVAEGVDVRILYDDLGTCKYLKGNYHKTLRKMGIKCYKFNTMIPLVSSYHNNRDHRKITVIDGVIGYTGGINLSDEYINLTSPFGHWKDNAIRLEGEGVDNLTILFMQIYSLSSRTINDVEPFLYKNNKEKDIVSDDVVIAFGSEPTNNCYENKAINVFLNMINSATRSIDITTPYLITDFSITNALIAASKKGIKIRVFFPSKPDKKIIWLLGKLTAMELAKNGVEIYSYTPGFNHAKSILIDDAIAFIGTTNLDYRSLLHHLECGVLVTNSECMKAIDENYEGDYLKSKLLTVDELKMNPIAKIMVTFLRVFQSLL